MNQNLRSRRLSRSERIRLARGTWTRSQMIVVQEIIASDDRAESLRLQAEYENSTSKEISVG